MAGRVSTRSSHRAAAAQGEKVCQKRAILGAGYGDIPVHRPRNDHVIDKVPEQQLAKRINLAGPPGHRDRGADWHFQLYRSEMGHFRQSAGSGQSHPRNPAIYPQRRVRRLATRRQPIRARHNLNGDREYHRSPFFRLPPARDYSRAIGWTPNLGWPASAFAQVCCRHCSSSCAG